MRGQTIAVSKLEYVAYVSEVWLSYYFDESSGGYLVITAAGSRALVSKNGRYKIREGAFDVVGIRA
jgi:hypothetical protein